MEFVTFRLANYETPLWTVENFSAGRYNSADAGVTQYLSLHPLTPWAELLRNEDRRTRERVLLMRYPLWAIRVQLAGPPLELTFESAGDHGLTPENLVADDQGPCRSLAARVREARTQSFTAPSAALPGTTNLIVLEPRVITGWNQIPFDATDWPGSLAAQDGRCPEGLWDHVHFRAAAPGTHAELEAWERGATFRFQEPEVSMASL
jgi:hypothetical protein